MKTLEAWLIFIEPMIREDLLYTIPLLERQLKDYNTLTPAAKKSLAYKIAHRGHGLSEQNTQWLYSFSEKLAECSLSEPQVLSFLNSDRWSNSQLSDLAFWKHGTDARNAREVAYGIAELMKLPTDERNSLIAEFLEKQKNRLMALNQQANTIPELRDFIREFRTQQEIQVDSLVDGNNHPNFGTQYRCHEQHPIPIDYYKDQPTNSWHERLVDHTKFADRLTPRSSHHNYTGTTVHLATTRLPNFRERMDTSKLQQFIHGKH